jgi:hypothetical protein
MLNFVVVWFLKTVLGNRVVMAVYTGGIQQIKTVHYTEDGKAYVHSEGKKVGFLDQPNNKAGEFRKVISDDKLIRWFDV